MCRGALPLPGAGTSLRPMTSPCRRPGAGWACPHPSDREDRRRVCRAWARPAGLLGSPRPPSSPRGPGPGVAAAPALPPEHPVMRLRKALSKLRGPLIDITLPSDHQEGLSQQPPFVRRLPGPPYGAAAKGNLIRPTSPSDFPAARPSAPCFTAELRVPWETRRNWNLPDIWARLWGTRLVCAP